MDVSVQHPKQIARPGRACFSRVTDFQVHYHATLIDGSVFYSSILRGTPVTFETKDVIKGWAEGIQLMTARYCTVLFPYLIVIRMSSLMMFAPIRVEEPVFSL